MPRRATSIYAIGALALVILALGVLGWLVSSLNELHERFARESWALGLAFLVVLVLMLAIGAAWLARLAWISRSGTATSGGAAVTGDVVEAARLQADQAEDVIQRLGDPAVKSDLNRELIELRAGRARREFRVVVFGTSSAGKTSLINALLGHDVGKTEAVMGTTRRAESHTYTMDGVDGTVYLTDTPGLAEIGEGGEAREREARELAARADLLLFVLDHDLVRAEYEPLAALVHQGKRSIVLLNKSDQFEDADRDAIVAKLRERLRGLIAPEDVVSGSAAPRPVVMHLRRSDGSTETVLEPQPPELGPLRDRIARVLKSEGDALRAGNLLLRAHLLSTKARDQLTRERDQKAEAVIEKFQWLTAATAFTNPFPALELLASGSVQFQMIAELASVYGVTLSAANVRTIGAEMIQMLLKLGLVEATTSLIAGIFKSSLVGYAAGGAVQAVSMAYLTHISGETFAEYFRHGQTWGDGGLQAALVHQFDLTSRAEFLQQFAKQVVQKASGRLISGASGRSETPTSKR